MKGYSVGYDEIIENSPAVRSFFAKWSVEELRSAFTSNRVKAIYDEMRSVPVIAALRDNRKKPTGILQGNVAVFLAIEFARRDGSGPNTVRAVCERAVKLGYVPSGGSRQFKENPVEYMRGYVSSAVNRKAVVIVNG